MDSAKTNSHREAEVPQKNGIAKDQLALIRSNLLSPNEVTFCNVSDTSSAGSTKRRRRLTSTDTDVDSIASSNYQQKRKPEIPDGGFGWVVVFSSLMVSLIADGVSFSFGLIYTELLTNFQESSPSKIAWVGSLFLAVPLLCGPIMSNLVDKYGCRKMTIIGGLLSGLGFVLASLCNSIEGLYFTFGIIAGLGLGIGYVTAVVSIAFWFDKKRTFATGIGASGTGLGTFIYAPFTQWLIETFGWRGATLILAGTLFNICVCGCLMRDPDWLIEENRLESLSETMVSNNNSSVALDEIKKLLETGTPKEDVLDTLMTNYNTEANQQIAIGDDISTAKKYLSEIVLPTYLESKESDVEGSIKFGSRRSLRKTERDPSIASDLLPPTKGEKRDKHIASMETLNESEKLSSTDELAIDSYSHVSTEDPSTPKIPWAIEKINTSRLSLDDALMSGHPPPSDIESNRRSFRGNSLDAVFDIETSTVEPSKPELVTVSAGVPLLIPPSVTVTKPRGIRSHSGKKRHPVDIRGFPSMRTSNFYWNMRVHRNSIHYRGALLNTHRYRLRASSCPNIYRNSMTTLAKEEDETWYDSFIDIIKSIFDFSLFKDPKFFIFNLSTFFLFIWFIIPYFYITEHLKKYNFPEEDAANLIAVIGIFNTIGMVFLGWVGDQPWLNVNKTYAFCLVACGSSVCLMPVAGDNYIALMALAVFFGITFASCFSFTPIILVRLVDLDEFTCAYGLVLLVQGVGSLIGPPLAGAIYDWTLRWDDSFYAAGFFIAVSGALAYVTGILVDREDETENYGNQFIIPYFYITEHLKKYNFPEEDAANLIAVIGIFNTIGMVFLGWVGDQPWLNVNKTYAFCLVVFKKV
uniref:Putative monocarboxylate transporter 9-like protein n=1 Tax=Lutzomyia longipalpis TaxID=7200 RepID=A0A7G3AQK6_LUTLO